MVLNMELIDFLKVDYFNQLREKMNAPLLDISDLPFRNGISYADLYDLQDGVEVTIDDIEIGSSGLLYYKGVLVTLNIKDVLQRREGQASLPKLHLCDCQKIKDMKNAGRIQRYISSNLNHRQREIRFVSNYSHSSKTELHQLDVCKYCLAQLQWKGYHSGMSMNEKNYIAQNVDLVEFYQEFEPQFYKELIGLLFNQNDQIAVNQYQKDWKFISYQYRKSKNWHCESCGKNFQKNHADLHTHHINGNKADNSLKNLSALCYDCHANQPMHEHMKNKTRHNHF